MSRLFTLVVCVSLTCGAPETKAPLKQATRRSEVIPSEFIVKLKENNGLVSSHADTVKSLGGTVLHQYLNLPEFVGYAVKASDDVVEHLRSLPGVEYIEENMQVNASADCKVQEEATWGIVRTNVRPLNLDGVYAYSSSTPDSVIGYVIDTGIYLDHPEFEGRAEWGTDTVDDPSTRTDENGHGTHVAGTMVSKTWGISKISTVVAVKVLGASGSGTNAGVIAGIDWAAADRKKRKKKGVANMSLGGSRSTATNDAVDAAVKSGLVLVVAAGNSNFDACYYSPASAAKAISVGATDSTDQRSYFSNYGKCVDIFGPGSGITSTWNQGPYSDNTISGTSMASPHVAGVAMKLWNKNLHYTAEQLIQAVLSQATNDTVKDVQGSPNKMVFDDCA